MVCQVIGNPVRLVKQPDKNKTVLELDGLNDVQEIMSLHTGAYLRMYTHMDESQDPVFLDKFSRDYPMSEIEFRSLMTFSKGQREAELALDKQRLETAEEYYNIANEQKHGYEKAMYIRKASRQLAREGKYCTFGSVALLRMMTRCSNIIKDYPAKIETTEEKYNELRSSDVSELSKRERQKHYRALNKTFNALCDYKAELRDASERLPKLKEEFREKRRRGIQIIGEANQKGNRFFEFHLDSAEPFIIMKITGRPRIKFYVNIPKDLRETAEKLQQLTDENKIAVTVTASDKLIVLSFDVAVMNGWVLDKIPLRKKLKKIKETALLSDEEKKEERKKAYIEYKKEQEELLATDKVNNRVLGFDSNPFFFGWAILDIDPNDPEKYKIVKCGYIHWYPLYKQWLKAKTPKQHSKVYNRIRNAVMMAMREMMDYARHYKCEKVAKEDLDFKAAQLIKLSSTNSKTKNLWMREVANNICAKMCSQKGIKRLEINAVYTSFIGGVQHRDIPDPTAAAVEIARRGGLYYIKNTFYPRLT